MGAVQKSQTTSDGVRGAPPPSTLAEVLKHYRNNESGKFICGWRKMCTAAGNGVGDGATGNKLLGHSKNCHVGSLAG
jgi:hypothetical protein